MTHPLTGVRSGEEGRVRMVRYDDTWHVQRAGVTVLCGVERITRQEGTPPSAELEDTPRRERCPICLSLYRRPRWPTVR